MVIACNIVGHLPLPGRVGRKSQRDILLLLRISLGVILRCTISTIILLMNQRNNIVLYLVLKTMAALLIDMIQ